MQHEEQHKNNAGAARRWVFWGFVAVAGFFLFTEHRAHLFGALPYLLLLACPLLHLFHRHGGHGRQHHATPAADSRTQDPAQSGPPANDDTNT